MELIAHGIQLVYIAPMNVSTLSKRMLHAVAVTVTFFLIFFGMQVPNVARLQPPTPRPRAVVETAVKAGQEAGPKSSIVAEACQNAFPLEIPPSYRSLPLPATLAISCVPIERRAARAPPPSHA